MRVVVKVGVKGLTLLVVRWWHLRYEPFISKLALFDKYNFGEDGTSFVVFPTFCLFFKLSLSLYCAFEP